MPTIRDMWGYGSGKASRGAAFCLLAHVAAGCGGRATQQNNELRLLDSLGLPASHTQALVDGKLVTTDEDGRAELGDLPARYDAVVVVATNVFAFVGLEARSPTLELDNVLLGDGDQHGASVTISKASTPADKQLFFAVGVTGGEIARQSMGYNGDEQSSWGNVTWVGSGDVTLSAQAFQADLDPETGSVIGYSGFASQAWPNADRQSAVDWTPEFAPPTFGTKTIHVDLAIPADVSVGWYSVYIVRSSGENGPIGTVYAGASADILVPDLPGATFDIYAALGGPAGSSQVALRGISAGATVHAEGGDGLRQLAPEDASENVTPETDFGWSTEPGAVYELYAYTDSPEQQYYRYFVATTSTTARLPDTSALGLRFPAGITFRWLARSALGFDSLAEYAATPERRTSTGFSGFRTFTTAR